MAKIRYSEIVRRLKEFAVSKGAAGGLVKEIKTRNIVVPGQWVKWKCIYGCVSSGRKLCCPPYVPSPGETREMFGEYERALLVGFPASARGGGRVKYYRQIAVALVELEREAFLLGCEKAFVLGAGPCYFCDKCIVEDLPENTPPDVARTRCRHHKLMRPSMEALGIDVFSTVRNAGLEIGVVDKERAEETRYFGLLLID